MVWDESNGNELGSYCNILVSVESSLDYSNGDEDRNVYIREVLWFIF